MRICRYNEGYQTLRRTNKVSGSILYATILFRENKERLYKSEVEIELQKKDIQSVKDKINEKCQTLAELKTQKEDLEQEYEVIKKEIDEKLSKTGEYLSKKVEDGTTRQNVKKEISNYLEGRKFNRDKIDSCFNQIYKECIDNPVNECLTILSQYKYECESIFESMKENGKLIKKKIETRLKEFNRINQDNITSFNQITAQVVNDLDNVNILVSKIKEENDSIEESRKSNSSYVNELSQYFDEIYNKWNSIEEIPQNTNFDDILSCIIKLKLKSDKSSSYIVDFLKLIEEKKDRINIKIETLSDKLNEREENIKRCNRNLNMLKGLEEGCNRKIGVMNREEIKNEIITLNSSIEDFNLKIGKYEQKVGNLIESKKKLLSDNFIYEAKRKKLGELSEKQSIVKTNISNKIDEIDRIEAEINELNKEVINFMRCSIIVRKNDITNERTDAIVNPANEYLTLEGGVSRAIVDKGGKIIRDECREYIDKYGKLLTGQAILLNSGNLFCKCIIHGAAPKYIKGALDNSLAESQMKDLINNIMIIVRDKNLDSVSISAISTGIYDFPITKAVKIICNTIKNFIKANSSMKDKTIVFCNLDDATTDEFAKYVPMIFCEDEEKKSYDQNEGMIKIKKKKKDEDEGGDSSESEDICRKCDKEIKERKHQREGSHLNACYKCYKEERNRRKDEDDQQTKNINKRRDDSDDDEEKEDRKDKKKKMSGEDRKKDDSSDESEDKKEKELCKEKKTKKEIESDSENNEEVLKISSPRKGKEVN